MEISGEDDKVKPSPRLNGLQNDAQLKMIYNVLNQNGVKLSQSQLNTLINQVQMNEQNLKNNSTKPKEKNNDFKTMNINYEPEELIYNSNKPKSMLKKDQYANLESSKFNQDEYKDDTLHNISEIKKDIGQGLSLIEKKKLQWQQDKDLLERLNQQEDYDALKSVSPRRFYTNNLSSLTKKENFNDFTTPNKLTLTEKKKIQWQKERGKFYENFSVFLKLNY